LKSCFYFWGCVVYCLVVFLFVSLCLSSLLCVCFFRVCMFVTFRVYFLLRLVFQSLYAMSMKVYCLFFFQGLLVVCFSRSTIYYLFILRASYLLIICLYVCLWRYMYNICLLFACLFIFVFEGFLFVYLFVYII
jgi:hypothetical protein